MQYKKEQFMKLAVFDLDHTLLPIDSDKTWGTFCVEQGWVDGDDFALRNQKFSEDYHRGCLDILEYTEFSTKVLLGKTPEQLAAMYQGYFDNVVTPALLPQAHALLNQYRDSGDWTLLLITATNAFVAGPIAQAFGFEHWLAVDLLRTPEGGWVNQVLGIPSLGQGKVDRLLQWLEANGKSWSDVSDSVMYSDSINDLPLLSFVDKAVATNPDPALLAVAQERGWEILHLFEKE